MAPLFEFRSKLPVYQLTFLSIALALKVYRLTLDPLFVAVIALLAFRGIGWLLGRSALDEGGIRCDGPFGFVRRYWSFDEIGRIDLRKSRLSVRNRQGAVLETWLLADWLEKARIYDTLFDHAAQRNWGENGTFSRGPRDFESWLAEIRRSVEQLESQSPYRAKEIDLELAKALVRDSKAPLEERAGAAYALLSSRDIENRRIASNAITESSPPLMIAVAALADGDGNFRGLARRVVGYLPRLDQTAWRKLADRSSS